MIKHTTLNRLFWIPLFWITLMIVSLIIGIFINRLLINRWFSDQVMITRNSVQQTHFIAYYHHKTTTKLVLAIKNISDQPITLQSATLDATVTLVPQETIIPAYSEQNPDRLTLVTFNLSMPISWPENLPLTLQLHYTIQIA
jgi:hypothetical protein